MRNQRSSQAISNHRRAALSGVSSGAVGTAIAGAALCAGLFALLPQAWSDPASPDTAPSVVTAAVKQTQAIPCAQQAWPYIDQNCGASANDAGKTRRVRVLSTDHGAPSIINTPMPTIAAKTQPAATAHTETGPAAKPAHIATNLVNYRQLPFQTAMQTEPKAANPHELSQAQQPQAQASSNVKTDAVAETKSARPETRKPVRTAARHTASEHKSAATRQASAQRNGEGLLVVHTVDYADGRRVTTYGSLNGSRDVAVAPRPELQRGFYVSSNDEDDEDF